MSKQHNHLDNLCLLHLDFDIWTGQTRLSASDLKLGEGGKIPPEKVAQLGSKKVCDPARLKGFNRLKTKARRLCLKHGMAFMNGFAVPLSKADEICDELDDLAMEFDQLKQSFIHAYDSAVEEWVSENPEYENAIRTGALPAKAVEKRIGFDYQVFMIQAVQNDSSGSERLNRKVESLGDDLLSEVCEEADKFYLDKLSGQSECQVATKHTLKNIRDKVDGLSFLNNAFDPLVRLLDETLDGYEKHGHGRKVTAPFFYQIMAAVLIMCDRKKIQQYADGHITVDGFAQTIPQASSSVGSSIPGDSVSQKDDSIDSPSVSEGEEENNPQGSPSASGISSDPLAGPVDDLDEDIDKYFSEVPSDGEQGNSPAEPDSQASVVLPEPEEVGTKVEVEEPEVNEPPAAPDFSTGDDAYF